MKYSISFILLLIITSCETSLTEIDTSKAPKIQVIDTDFSKGKLSLVQGIHLDDVALFHGHLCDGLVVGYLGLNEALQDLYPNGIVDRTNTRIISNSSPCLTDVAIYVTGGRYQFNSFYVDDKIDGFYHVQRMDTEQSIRVDLKPDVKPKAIDSLGRLAIQQKLNACELAELKKLEDNFSHFLLTHPVNDVFEIQVMKNFNWQPKPKNDYMKSDIINKNSSCCNTTDSTLN